jgi:transposase InsO family protein
MALYNRGIKNKVIGLTLRSDNGSQFIAHEFEKLCIKEEEVWEASRLKDLDKLEPIRKPTQEELEKFWRND